MLVKIRNLSNFNGETQIKISKTADIARLKDEIEKILGIKPNLQNLYYGGKHLELKNTLYDYKICANDVIQLMVRSDCYVLMKNLTPRTSGVTENTIEETEDKKEKFDDFENVESDYYVIEDPIDCLDFRYGAWFEATIKRICKIDGKLMYVVKWDLVENAQLFYTSEESIRPRANKVVAEKDLKIGEKVMINHNLDHPLDIGFWYDFDITNIFSVENRYVLTGTLYMGKNNESLYDHRIVLREKVYAVEKPKLLKDRDLENERYASDIRRAIAPECLHCYDKIEVNCKECGCAVCGGKDNPQLVIICDECEDEYHINCLKPPLLEIPEDDWYCPKCKTNENEIVKMGQMVKKRPLNKCKELLSKTKKSKAIESKSKPIISSKIPANHRGAIPGIEVGACWENRIHLFNSGVHAAMISGIHGHLNDCAYSLILSGNYNDVDNGNEFIYTGSGGHGDKGSLKVPISNQTLTRANKALALNCKAEFNDEKGATAIDWRAGIPVRVIRSYKLAQFSQYAPTEGNRYDGLYKVVKYYPEIDQSGFRKWRYLLRRDDPAPPPWTPEGRMRCLELGLAMNNKIKSSQDISQKIHRENKKVQVEIESLDKKEEQEHYYLNNEVSALIEKDYVNYKLWEDGKSYLPNGKEIFLNQVFLSLQCVCCHDLVFKPVTTPCAHNICQICLEKSFSAGLKFCPTCRFDLKNISFSVNNELTKILFLLFPKHIKGKK